MKEVQEIIGTGKPLVLLILLFIFVDEKVLTSKKANQTHNGLTGIHISQYGLLIIITLSTIIYF